MTKMLTKKYVCTAFWHSWFSPKVDKKHVLYCFCGSFLTPFLPFFGVFQNSRFLRKPGFPLSPQMSFCNASETTFLNTTKPTMYNVLYSTFCMKSFTFIQNLLRILADVKKNVWGRLGRPDFLGYTYIY